jgi:hypothetical protein
VIRIDSIELQVAAKEWGDADSDRKVLALHGWMDNAASEQRPVPRPPSPCP